MAKIPTLKPRLAVLDTRRAKPLPKVGAPLYGSSEWIALRRRILRERGARCESPECASPRRGADGGVEVDHIIEVADGGAPLDPRNAQVLCLSCHRLKTAYVRAERARADGVPRWPGSVGPGVISGGTGRDDGKGSGGGWGCL